MIAGIILLVLIEITLQVMLPFNFDNQRLRVDKNNEK